MLAANLLTIEHPMNEQTSSLKKYQPILIIVGGVFLALAVVYTFMRMRMPHKHKAGVAPTFAMSASATPAGSSSASSIDIPPAATAPADPYAALADKAGSTGEAPHPIPDASAPLPPKDDVAVKPVTIPPSTPSAPPVQVDDPLAKVNPGAAADDKGLLGSIQETMKTVFDKVSSNENDLKQLTLQINDLNDRVKALEAGGSHVADAKPVFSGKLDLPSQANSPLGGDRRDTAKTAESAAGGALHERYHLFPQPLQVGIGGVATFRIRYTGGTSPPIMSVDKVSSDRVSVTFKDAVVDAHLPAPRGPVSGLNLRKRGSGRTITIVGDGPIAVTNQFSRGELLLVVSGAGEGAAARTARRSPSVVVPRSAVAARARLSQDQSFVSPRSPLGLAPSTVDGSLPPWQIRAMTPTTAIVYRPDTNTQVAVNKGSILEGYGMVLDMNADARQLFTERGVIQAR